MTEFEAALPVPEAASLVEETNSSLGNQQTGKKNKKKKSQTETINIPLQPLKTERSDSSNGSQSLIHTKNVKIAESLSK